ncbi:MAG: tetratricopeptide repeat protein [Nitrosomonadales bacterium]|nr:tetratricopeptide repeat protein [Nitrosomonadales bacterium]
MITTFPQTQAFDGVLQQAVAHHQAGRLQEAERLYRSILQANPNQPDTNHNMGLLAMQLGQPASALPYFEKAWKNNPADEQFCMMLADCLLQLDRADDALHIVKNAMQRKGFRSDHARSLLRLAESIVSGKRPLFSTEHEALALFNAKNHPALEAMIAPLTMRYPNWDMGWQLLGLALMSQNKDGLAALRRAVELDTGNAEGHYNLGIMLYRQGLASEAEASYRRALEIRPDYAEAHYNLGDVFRKLDRLGEAEASYRRALQIKPDYAGAHNNLGNTLMDMGRLEEAETSYRRALEIKPDCEDAFGNLLFALNYHPDKSGEEIFEVYREYDAKFGLPNLTVSHSAEGRIAALKSGSKCSFTLCKLRFFTRFCLALHPLIAM